ncbi:MAG: VanZ family protein [Candidatus Omnitrophica bacterium]|nr:VanZ family protein [Candidatus Omnitrophota bacterium]
MRAVNQIPKNNSSRGRIFEWIPSVVWAGIIFALAILPSESIPTVKVSHIDSAAHFVVYAVLAILILRGFLRADGFLRRKIVLFTLILTGGYGILMELIQCLVPSRDASAWDIFFNFAGVVFGITVGRFVLWRK